jgi:hypothetical protein
MSANDCGLSRSTQQPIKFNMAINAKTAKSLGIAVTPRLLGLAEEMID